MYAPHALAHWKCVPLPLVRRRPHVGCAVTRPPARNLASIHHQRTVYDLSIRADLSVACACGAGTPEIIIWLT